MSEMTQALLTSFHHTGQTHLIPFKRKFDYPMLSECTQKANMEMVLKQETCCICLDLFELNDKNIRQLKCSHCFHENCMNDLLSSSHHLCPLCKVAFYDKGKKNVFVIEQDLHQRMISDSLNDAYAIYIEHSNQASAFRSAGDHASAHHYQQMADAARSIANSLRAHQGYFLG
jgi:hypothetical protein